jgi:hypothetical protein
MKYQKYVNYPVFENNIEIGRFTGYIYENGIKDGVVSSLVEVDDEWMEQYIIVYIKNKFINPFYIRNSKCYLQITNEEVDFIKPLHIQGLIESF